MNDPNAMQTAIVQEIGRLRLSEIEAGLIVSAQAAEIESLKAQIAKLTEAATPIVEQRV